MIYAYSSRIGLVPCSTRDEAIEKITPKYEISSKNDYTVDIQIPGVTEAEAKEIKNIIFSEISPYFEYKRTYEAILLYIIKRGNMEYPEYLNEKKIGQIFTLTMLRWYNQTNKSYTQEKPIKCGKIAEYKNQIGFPSFNKYFENILRDIQSRTYEYNGGNAKVYWTEIPEETIIDLVDDTRMIQIIRRAVRDAQYPNPAKRNIKNMYNRTSNRWKLKKGAVR